MDKSVDLTHTVDDFFGYAAPLLVKAGIDTARLDVELLLAHKLNKSREQLVAHGDEMINPNIWQDLTKAIHRRSQRYPLAYLINHKEFYGRDFIVNDDVLIPRPESEQIISNLARLVTGIQSERGDNQLTLLDIGTGSGCLAITAKLEHPELAVVASDLSDQALAIARQNADQLGADIQFVQSDLFDNLPSGLNYDIILANLPYVDQSWSDTSPEIQFEPAMALYTTDNGLAIIHKALDQAPLHLTTGGYLILEMDSRQIDTVSNYAVNLGYVVIRQQPFTLTLRYLPQTAKAEQD